MHGGYAPVTKYFKEKKMSEEPKKLKYCVGGQWLESKTEKYMDCYNPSTGEVIAKAPCCTSDEVESAIAAAKRAFPGWSETPASKGGSGCLIGRKAPGGKNPLENLPHFPGQRKGEKPGNESMVGRSWKVKTNVVEFPPGGIAPP